VQRNAVAADPGHEVGVVGLEDLGALGRVDGKAEPLDQLQGALDVGAAGVAVILVVRAARADALDLLAALVLDDGRRARWRRTRAGASRSR
jgi:hypothetical protein